MRMNGRLKKIILLLVAVALLAGGGRVQLVLNRDRDQLGLTRVAPLENAPPVLAFTTVALGGFRGLISNFLWMRAGELQDEGKYFEMKQLADWITKLEPHFEQVWVHQAWNMAYNISVKFKEAPTENPYDFKEFPDRWRWVKAGIELLRDQGLRYNPNSVLIHRELAWFFQHKMGANLDDANMYYKQQWTEEMETVFGEWREPDVAELVNPQTEDRKQRAALLREKYKMDPAFMLELNERHGPLEWRLPEAHAIYWAAVGLRKAEENPGRVNKDDLIQLRRVIYQSMQTSFQRGRLELNPYVKRFEFGPNLDIIPKVVAAYEEAMEEDERNRDHIATAHRNLLRQAVYFLYVHNRLGEAAKWFRYLGQKYPDKPLLDGNTNSLPGRLTLDDYAVHYVLEDINETSRDRVKSAIEGYLTRAFYSLVVGQDDRAAGFRLMAQKIRETYREKIGPQSWARIPLPTIEETSRIILEELLDPETGYPPEARAVLLSKLGITEQDVFGPRTNSVPRPQ